jgi:hypothetical protein
MIQVAVWVNAESGAKANIDDFKLGRFGEYPVITRTTGDPFSVLWADVDAGHRRSFSLLGLIYS